ncbi:MAG: TMEM165/GDT1 family protein [Candidatus Omnitrophota bacterium]
MDWKIFFATFGAIFFAELADKTQLVGIGMSAKTGKAVNVWMGSVAAYMVVTAISVIIGLIAGSFLKPELIKICGGTLFIVMGILMLAGKL